MNLTTIQQALYTAPVLGVQVATNESTGSERLVASGELSLIALGLVLIGIGAISLFRSSTRQKS